MEDQSQLLTEIAERRCAESFRRVFDFYSPKLMAFAVKGKLSDAQARDFVQEVMTLIWTKAHLYNPEKGSVSAWIFTVARNCRYDIYRRNQKEQSLFTSDDLWSENSSADEKNQAEEKMQNDHIKNQVGKLPETQREVIENVYFSGLTQEECAEKMNVPLGTVKSRIRLALRKLNKVVKA